LKGEKKKLHSRISPKETHHLMGKKTGEVKKGRRRVPYSEEVGLHSNELARGRKKNLIQRLAIPNSGEKNEFYLLGVMKKGKGRAVRRKGSKLVSP